MPPSSMPSIECHQQHASVFVSDLQSAIDFYTDKLGFRSRSSGVSRRHLPA
jgi:catechol 2,3-dioxygenase-like lactoylglutathione lyase family enzyme